MLGSLARGLLLLGLGVSSATAQTELVLDGSLPNGLTTDLVASPAQTFFVVDEALGEGRGGNLFHSFDRFSIGERHTVEFRSTNPYDRVLTRVTGGDASRIDGTLRSTIIDSLGDGADFYLLNPAGVLFGEGGSVDLSGSLFLSSADTLRFDNGDVLDVLDTAAPVLSVGSPESFGFRGGTTPGEIAIRLDGAGAPSFSTFAVANGESLVLVGGDVRIGARTASRLNVNTVGGALRLAAVGDASAVVDVDTGELASAEPDALGRVEIGSGTSLFGIDGANPNGPQGRLVIRGGRLEIVGSTPTDFTDLNYGGENGGSTPAIDIETHASVSIDGVVGVGAVASGDQVGGGMRLTTGTLTVSIDGPFGGIASDVRGAGGARAIEIDADVVRLESGGGISSTVSPLLTATGGGASVDVNASTIEVVDGAAITTSGNSTATSGTITLSGDVLRVEDGGAIEAATTGAAAGGDVVIDVERLEVGASAPGETPGFASTSSAGGVGPGGDIVIAADDVVVTDGGQISTTSSGGGDSGDIRVDAANDVRLVGDAPTGPSGLFAQADAGGGSGGDIVVAAESIRVEGGASITSISRAAGDAGEIRLEAREDIVIAGEGSVPSIVSALGEIGGAGDITLDAPSIEVASGGSIETRVLGTQPGGTIRITGGDLAILGAAADGIQRSTLTARAEGSGVAGSIDANLEGRIDIVGATVETRSLQSGGGEVRLAAGERIRIGDGAEIVTLVDDLSGNAGDITLAAPLVTLDQAFLGATAIDGAGGDIRIDAPQIFESSQAVLDPRSIRNVDGEIFRKSPVVDLSGQLGRLETRPTDATDRLERACASRSSVVGSLVVAGGRAEERFEADDLSILPAEERAERGGVTCP